MKMNSLVDPEMIEALYDASAAGAEIDLDRARHLLPAAGREGPVRADPGALDRRPLSRALADLPLRQRRSAAPRYYIGSADLMPRNLDRRVECVAPVTDPALTARLAEILEVNLADDVLAWELRPDGWRKVPTKVGVNTHAATGSARRGARARPSRGGRSWPSVKSSLEPLRRSACRPSSRSRTGWSPTRSRPLRVSATYLDTDDLRLTGWGVSLRHRTSDGWTVKLPQAREGKMLVREELVFPGNVRRPPAEAVDLVSAFVRTAPLGPQVRLRTVRRQTELSDGEGRRVADVVDDDVSVLDGRRIAARFRELEVEALDETHDDLIEALVARLRESGAGPPDPTPKVVRALGPRASRPQELSVAELGADATHRRGRPERDRRLGRALDPARPDRPSGHRRRGGPSGTGGDATSALRPAHLPPAPRPGMGEGAPRRARMAGRQSRGRAGRRRAARADPEAR